MLSEIPQIFENFRQQILKYSILSSYIKKYIIISIIIYGNFIFLLKLIQHYIIFKCIIKLS